MAKPRIAVHKFTSCDGCQLAFLNLGEALLQLAGMVEICHFVEAGMVDPRAQVDVAFVEGSISTPEEAERIVAVRENSRYLVALGACATSGGIQALRNGAANRASWLGAIYASLQTIASLAQSTPLSAHIKVDLELWGCPVTGQQIVATLRDLLSGVVPRQSADSVCQECKREGHACVLVSRGEPCMGAVTRAGCGALCPGVERACYGCFGPAEQANPEALAQRLAGLGLNEAEIVRRFLFIHAASKAFSGMATFKVTHD